MSNRGAKQGRRSGGPSQNQGGENKQTQKMDKFLKSPADNIKTRANKVNVQQKELDLSTGSRFALLQEEGGGDTEEGEECNPTILENILKEVQKCNKSINEMALQIGSLNTDIMLIRDDSNKARERLNKLETTIPEMSQDIDQLKINIKEIKEENKDLREKVTDLEDRSRRANIRILGMAEGIEGHDPVKYIQNWLLQIFPELKENSTAEVERAHRIPAKRPPPGSPPRVMLIKMLSSKDRDFILRKKREMPDVEIDGQKIIMFPDYSRATQRKRGTFIEVKRRLRTAQISYSLLFPARLRVAYNDNVFFFSTAQEASSWLESKGY